MNLIFVGPPGSGKGTQASILSNFYKIPSISTGDLLRYNVKESTEIGLLAKSFIDKGELVPDDVIIKIIEDRFNKKDIDKGFILDGFPRTVKQAEALNSLLEKNNKKIDNVINFVISDEIIVKRISGRFSCENCGEIYNKFYKNTKIEGQCDSCLSKSFVVRSDDNELSVINRLKSYHNTTSELIDYYVKKDLIISINADNNSNDIFEELKNSLVK